MRQLEEYDPAAAKGIYKMKMLDLQEFKQLLVVEEMDESTTKEEFVKVGQGRNCC